MIENLLNLVREHSAESIVANPAIPNEHNEAAISEASNGIASALKSQLTSGNTDQLTSLFSNVSNLGSSPLVGNIIQSVAGNLMQKFGISASQAGSIAGSLIPGVMTSLVNKTNDPQDNSFTMEGIMSSLTGGKGGIGNLLGGLLGGK